MDANTLTLLALVIILVGFVWNQFIKPFRSVAASSAGAIFSEEAIEQAQANDAPLAPAAWLDYVNG